VRFFEGVLFESKLKNMTQVPSSNSSIYTLSIILTNEIQDRDFFNSTVPTAVIVDGIQSLSWK
jgi:hypothetical protein